MKSKDGFVQAYNAQAAVDAGTQIIVAHELTQCGNDQRQLVPFGAIVGECGRQCAAIARDAPVIQSAGSIRSCSCNPWSNVMENLRRLITNFR
jgi:hypothetical protein